MMEIGFLLAFLIVLGCVGFFIGGRMALKNETKSHCSRCSAHRESKVPTKAA